MSLALVIVPPIIGQALDASTEISGRGYRRPPTGPLTVRPPSVATYYNTLPIQWPQAPVDWGPAPFTALVRDADGVVLASSANPPAYMVRAFDQPRVGPRDLLLAGVLPHTPRPYGSDRYGESAYGTYPAEGAIFFDVVLTGFAWARQPNACGPWSAVSPITSGSCCA